jgi:hypothetical protein
LGGGTEVGKETLMTLPRSSGVSNLKWGSEEIYSAKNYQYEFCAPSTSPS